MLTRAETQRLREALNRIDAGYSVLDTTVRLRGKRHLPLRPYTVMSPSLRAGYSSLYEHHIERGYA